MKWLALRKIGGTSYSVVLGPSLSCTGMIGRKGLAGDSAGGSDLGAVEDSPKRDLTPSLDETGFSRDRDFSSVFRLSLDLRLSRLSCDLEDSEVSLDRALWTLDVRLVPARDESRARAFLVSGDPWYSLLLLLLRDSADGGVYSIASTLKALWLWLRSMFIAE